MSDIIYNLEISRPTDKKEQVENFITNMLCLILFNSKQVRRDFFKLILHKRKISTKIFGSTIKKPNDQDIRAHEQDEIGIPDIVIGSDETRTIAIENKIDSIEGHNQVGKYLQRYDYVLYISKRYEKLSGKYETNRKFLGCIRWHEIFPIIQKYAKRSNLLREFKEYLILKEMDIEMRLKGADLLVWQKYIRLDRKIKAINERTIGLIENKLNYSDVKEMVSRRVENPYKGIRFIVNKNKYRYHRYPKIYWYCGFYASPSKVIYSVDLHIPKKYHKHVPGIYKITSKEVYGNIYRDNNWFGVQMPIKKIIKLGEHEDKQIKDIIKFIKKAVKIIMTHKYLKKVFSRGW